MSNADELILKSDVPLLRPDQIKCSFATPDVFKGASKNFMTPNLICYYRLWPGFYAELSHGKGMSGQTIYGVTVRPDLTNGTHRLSMLCESASKAYTHIAHVANLLAASIEDADKYKELVEG